MLNVDDIKATFGERIELENGYISAEDFANIFFDAASMSYADLITSDANGERGYKNFFDKCKVEGILV
jgi:hypothetical protein